MHMGFTKRSLRTLMLNKLRNQKKEAVKEKSLKIKEKLFSLKVFKQAKTVMFYLALASEVQTRFMIGEAIRLGKKVAVATCDIRHKKIIPCLLTGLEAKDFKKGAHCIDEPCCKKPIPARMIDLCIVPGLAFDAQGNRLGRGRGYYDRFLAALPDDTPKIGLAFKFQILKHLLKVSPHDIRVDKVLFA